MQKSIEIHLPHNEILQPSPHNCKIINPIVFCNIRYNWGFKCCCDVCKEEEIHPEQNLSYKMYENLQSEVRKCLGSQKNQDREARLENIKKEVACHKGMALVWHQ